VTLGVCSDICVPARAQFSLPLSFAKPDAAQSIRLTQALADVPATWSKTTPPFASAAPGSDDRSLVLKHPDPALSADSLIAEGPDPAIPLGAPQKSPDGALWTLHLEGGTAEGLVGHSILLTFETVDGPFTAAIPVSPAAN